MNTNDIHISLPASKSISNRWLVVNHIMGNPFVLRRLSEADDTVLMQALLGQLAHGTNSTFYCAGAGSVARFLLALLAVTPGQWLLTGDERLCQRPFAPLVNSLRSMGCDIQYQGQDGCLPLRINGHIPQFKMVDIDPTASSQFVSALLLIGPLLPNGIRITLTDRAASRPYINMTLAVLQQAGIKTTASANQRVYTVDPLPQQRPPCAKTIDIERDWSSASYFYSAAALIPGRRIRLQGLSLSASQQGDSVAADIFQHLGVTTKEVRSPYKKNTRSVTIEGNGGHEKRFEYNFIDCPDLLPAVLVTCAALGIDARLKGVKNLRLKESDRLQALSTELARMGGRMTLTGTQIHFHPSELHPTEPICTYGDHRIAMAFAILSLRYPDIIIQNPELVTKSFPDFWSQLELLKKKSSAN